MTNHEQLARRIEAGDGCKNCGARGKYCTCPEDPTPQQLAALAEKQGFAIVPLEPTDEMHEAARDWSIEKYGQAIGNDASEGCYKAMVEVGRVKP